MKLGIVSDEVHGDLAYAASWARERDMERLEIRSLWGKRVPDLTNLQLREAQAILRDQGLVVSALSPGLYKCSMKDPEFENQGERLKRTMDMAERLGCRKIISFGVKKDAGDGEGAVQRVLEKLQEVSAEASSQRFVLCFENEPGYYNGTPEEIIQLQKAVFPKGGRLNWDMGNLFMAGYRDYEEVYAQVKPYIASIHMKDYRADGPCVPLGDGCLRWEAQIRDFMEDDLQFMGDAVDMNLETHCTPLEACARRSYEFARNCMCRIGAK